VEFLVQFFKDFLIPGSTTFLLICLAAGVALLFFPERFRKWAKIWLGSLLLFYWIISSPLGARILESGLVRSYPPIETKADADHAQAIVILGGGSINLRSRGEVISFPVTASALRVLEGARIYKLLDDPLVIASGGSNLVLGGGIPESDLLYDMLKEMGVPDDRIEIEPNSQNTREQAENLKSLLEANNIKSFVLVTSPIHMLRSIAVFEAQGMKPVPGPASLHSEGFLEDTFILLPSIFALDASQSAMREYMALAYYWANGWLRSP